jgi:alkane 1-monooxygenase
MKYLKYLNPLLVYFLAYVGFTQTGFYCWLVPMYAFVFVPLVELLITPNEKNLSAAEEEMAKQDKVYDYLLYTIVALQLPILFFFFYTIQNTNLTTMDVVGRVFSMGILCGTFGINVGHELGHRKNTAEQWMAKLLLMTSLYMHFFVEHNKGHHKNVATPHDPSSARLNEAVYLFYFRTIFGAYRSAWHIANTDTKKTGRQWFSLHNEMIQMHFIQIALLVFIYFYFGSFVWWCFLGAAIIGILMLETVNYIEHYGLQRKATATGFERVQPHHSWNSNHGFGRIILFELSRHSDHHYLASRKYQILRHHDNAPQLPTGYPGSMLLSLVPPLWFSIMNKKIQLLQAGTSTQVEK